MTKVLQRRVNGIQHGLFTQMERRIGEEVQATSVELRDQGCWALAILTTWDIIEGKNVKEWKRLRMIMLEKDTKNRWQKKVNEIQEIIR